jgi:serine/threonine protein kinase
MDSGIRTSLRMGNLEEWGGTPPPRTYLSQKGAARFCLGRPPHAVQPEEVICHVCGTLVAGARLGIYQVQQCLGRGRNGSAYLSVHLRSHQPVVIKLFPPHPATMGQWEAARRTVRSITALRHSSILPVFSCTTWHAGALPGTTRPLHELITAYTGRDDYLLTLCQYAPVTLSQFAAHYERSKATLAGQKTHLIALLIQLLQQAAAALSASHARGITHGALVPGNVLLDGRERLWIADFGLARLHPPPSPYLAPELYSVARSCVQSGNMASYAEALEPASDQYMLAMLCQQLLARVLQPADYEQAMPVLQCATSQQPGRRFASIEIFMHELAEQLTHGRTLPVGGSSPEHMRKPASSFRWEQFLPTSPANESFARTASYSLAASLPAPTPADDWEKLGGKFFTAHDYEAAVKAYRHALELDASKPALWLALGDAYLALEDYPASLKAYEEAVTLNPDDPQAWSNCGIALDALGRHEEAIRCYERADQLNA